MDACPSWGESLNLVEDVGLRPADETEAVPGGEKPVRPRPEWSAASAPGRWTRPAPDRHSAPVRRRRNHDGKLAPHRPGGEALAKPGRRPPHDLLELLGHLARHHDLRSPNT